MWLCKLQLNDIERLLFPVPQELRKVHFAVHLL